MGRTPEIFLKIKMSNKHYRKGADKERKLVNEERALGRVAFRSAGSKSPVDVCSIDIVNKHIKLIQAKTYELSELEKKRIFAQLNITPNDLFTVEFVII